MTIVGILELNSNISFGFTKKGVKLFKFESLDNKKFIVGSKSQERKNKLCIIKQMNDDKIPRGELVKIIGDWDDEQVREEA
jgi:hypothetical protein